MIKKISFLFLVIFKFCLQLLLNCVLTVGVTIKNDGRTDAMIGCSVFIQKTQPCGVSRTAVFISRTQIYPLSAVYQSA